MPVTATLTDTPRSLRDGEFLVDCAKARAAFEAAHGVRSEDRAADTLGITRSVLRRILGREDLAGWAIVTTPNARSFAEKCGIRLDTIQWSVDETGQRATAAGSVSSYLQLWQDVYGLGLGPLVPLTMRCNDAAIDASAILESLQTNQTVQLSGPSGCGKSHLLIHLALMLPTRGFVPIFARAADFDGDIDTLLNRAVSNVAPLGFTQLVRACGKASQVPVVILDAINECQSSLRMQLLAALQKLRAQFDFPIIFSNQRDLVLPAMLVGQTIVVSPPDRVEKRALVEAYLGRAMPEDAHFSLDIISSAQDAMVWAEVFAHSDVATSRFGLYEAFVRRRLAGDQNVAIAQRALALLAHEMRQTFVFSVPEAAVRRAIDRVISTSEHADRVRMVIDRSGLLPMEQGRVGFRHELLQDYFSVEELLRVAPNMNELGQTLSKPLNTGLAEFAVGALASGVEVASALSSPGSPVLLSACLSGRCGPAARQYVEGECAAALGRLRDRYCAVSFDLSQEHERELSVNMSCATPFKPQDASYLAAAMMIFPDGRIVGAVLDMIRRIDEYIEAERSRLRALYPDKKIAWRARMFTALYCNMPVHSGADEFRVALQAARMSGLWRDPKDSYNRMASLLSGHRSLTPGQLYFLIEGFHTASSREVLQPAFLYGLAERAWSFHIYHLQLATTHMQTMHCHNLPEDDRQRFIALVEGWLDNNNPVMNGCVIDVLKVLGALDDQFTPENATAEFEEVLASPDSQEANELAFSIYCRMFDHPYDSAYGQAFYDLSEPKRAALLARAVKTDDTDSMFFSFLLTEVAKQPTPELVPALQRVATVPNANTISTQESISTFVTSIATLAKLSSPLAVDEVETNPDALREGWRCMGRILYLLHTPEMTQVEYAHASEQHWNFLEAERLIDYPMRIVRDRWRDQDETTDRFLNWSKERLLQMSRDTLAKPQLTRSWFPNSYRERELFCDHLQFALSILEMFGDRRDLPVIASLVDSPEFGMNALKAARGIESR